MPPQSESVGLEPSARNYNTFPKALLPLDLFVSRLSIDLLPNYYIMAAINRDELEKPKGEYRQYLPDLNLKRFQVMCTQDAHEYAHAFKTLKHPPWLHALYMHWLDLLQEPFKGVTTDGKLL